MFKLHLSLFSIFLIFTIESNGQLASVVYEKHITFPKEILQQLDDALPMIESRPLRKSYLHYKDGKSSYRIQMETLYSTKHEDKTGSIPMYERAVFKDFFEETLTYIDMMNDTSTAAVMTIPSRKDWHLTSETRLIVGYLCKLIQKRNKYGIMQNVWYTQEIPIFDGPEEFCNFPGLVLEFERGGTTITAIQVTHDKKGKYAINSPKIRSTISYIEFENRLAMQMKF